MCALEVAPAIGTDRLILRRPVKADAERLVEFCNDLAVAGMVSTMPHPYARDHAEAFLARCEAPGRAAPEFAVEHREFGLIGMLGFKAEDPLRPEVGYWIGRPFWGRGYASEALRAALAWAKSDWRKKVVWAGHFADNKASGQVLCKAGFLYTGEVELRESLARGEKVPTRMMVWLA